MGNAKKCSKCGDIKPLADFHKRSASTDGLSSKCRDCKKAADAAHYARNSEAIKKRTRAYEVANLTQVRARQADWRDRNREAFNDYQAAYREKNREQRRAWKRAYHRERYAKDPDYRLRCKLDDILRRNRKRGNGYTSISVEGLEAKFAYWNNACWVCGEEATAVDHVKPLAVGGAHMLCNLRPICTACNGSKSDKWPLPSRAALMGFTG